MHLVPSFINNADIQDSTIHFRWDERNTESVDEPAAEEIISRFNNLSYRASLAFTIASAEWVLGRFGALLDETIPYQCLEAAWLQQIDFLYSWDWELDREWKGSIKGPIRLALDKVTWAVQETRDYRHPSWAAATISKLVEYILTDSSPYIQWREQIISRLERFYRMDQRDELGDVVPPAAFDPNLAFDPEQTEILMNEFLAKADHKINPFLSSPEGMLEASFEGTPYVFNLAEDRKHRFEW